MPSSVEKHGDSYVVTVPGKVEATLPDDLGYSGAKMVEQDNATKITIMAAPETVITNYLKKNLDADVKIVAVAPIKYEIRTNVTRESLDALLAPVGGKVPTGEDTFVEGVTPDTVDETKKVLDSKLNRLGLQDIKVQSRRQQVHPHRPGGNGCGHCSGCSGQARQVRDTHPDRGQPDACMCSTEMPWSPWRYPHGDRNG